MSSRPSLSLLIALSVIPLAAHALPKPDRGTAPDSKLYDYGVMGPPATPEIVAAANASVTTPLPPGPFAAT